MIKRKIKSDVFPAPRGPVSWLNQYDVVRKYQRYGVTLEYLRYNRSFQFRNRLTITKDEILLVKRTGAATCLYRSDTTEEFIKRVFNIDNIVKLEQNMDLTSNTSNTNNTRNS